MVNDTTLLLGLDGVRVTSVQLHPDGRPIIHLATADERASACPQCGVLSRTPHGFVTTRPRDLALAGRTGDLRWRKHRWLCTETGCPRKSFTGSLPQIPARSRLTCRLREATGTAVGDGGRTVVQSGRDHGVSWPIVNAAFLAHAQKVIPAEVPQVERLGIDETRRGKAQWRLNPDTRAYDAVVDRWHIGFVDLGGGQGLLGQVEGRTCKVVTEWLDARGDAWKKSIEFAAIDMCTVFKSAIRTSLPDAVLVVDRFHVAQLANQALTEVRRRVTVQQRGRRGRKGNREWELRNRLTRSAARVHSKHLDPMVDDLKALPPKIGLPILAAWNAKEDLMDLLALMHTNPARTQIAHRLTRFYTACAEAGIPEFERLATTVPAWWPEIEAAIVSGVSNAGSEGTNRIIKTIARDAYGFRNPENQRLRTRCATTRRARGHLTHGQVR